MWRGERRSSGSKPPRSVGAQRGRPARPRGGRGHAPRLAQLRPRGLPESAAELSPGAASLVSGRAHR